MLLSLVLVALFAIVNSQTINPPGCGLRPNANRYDDKIVGGREAKVGDWSWTVLIKYNGRHICGGTLIHKNWVLTAAHCVQGSNVLKYWIDVGIHDRFYVPTTAQDIGVQKIVRHPSYNSTSIQHDLALFKLESSAKVNGNNIIIACITDTSVDLANAVVWATGWGHTSTFGSVSSQKKNEVSKNVLSDSECKAAFGSSVNPTSQICAGRTGLGRDTCHGDSGGPLVYQNPTDKLWYLVGVTSFGSEICGDGGIYVRVSAYADWIKKTIEIN